MTKLFWKSLVLTPVLLGAALFTGTASAQQLSADETLNQVNDYVTTGDNLGQLRSVSQLSDVKPTDWAYQAVRSLVERYNCVAGYPDGTFRGGRAMTRYEAAALVNACMDTVNDLIAAATADLVTKEDLAVLQRLQEEFQAELATLRGRVDSLEAPPLNWKPTNSPPPPNWMGKPCSPSTMPLMGATQTPQVTPCLVVGFA